jgi:hypothetical protein
MSDSEMESNSSGHLLDIMPIQRATLDDELTLHQPTNYTVWSENGVANSSAQTYKFPAGMTQTLNLGRWNII